MKKLLRFSGTIVVFLLFISQLTTPVNGQAVVASDDAEGYVGGEFVGINSGLGFSDGFVSVDYDANALLITLGSTASALLETGADVINGSQSFSLSLSTLITLVGTPGIGVIRPLATPIADDEHVMTFVINSDVSGGIAFNEIETGVYLSEASATPTHLQTGDRLFVGIRGGMWVSEGTTVESIGAAAEETTYEVTIVFTPSIDDYSVTVTGVGSSSGTMGGTPGEDVRRIAYGSRYDSQPGSPSFTKTTYDDYQMSNSELPVELTHFDALSSDDTVTLNWETASELNNAGFEVQRQVGQTFVPVGFVTGHGTSSERQQYSYTVEGLGAGDHIFRLKQIDFDGSYEYSPLVETTLFLTGPYELSAAYPNPFNPETQFTLTLAEAQHVQVSVYDITGREVALLHEGQLASNQPHDFRFQANNLPSGIYFYRVTGEHFNETRRLLLLK